MHDVASGKAEQEAMQGQTTKQQNLVGTFTRFTNAHQKRHFTREMPGVGNYFYLFLVEMELLPFLPFFW